MFKEHFGPENCLINLSPALTSNLICLMLSYQKCPIQQLRYRDIPRYLRICDLCNLDEDGIYYVLLCDHLLLTVSWKVYFVVYFVHHQNSISSADEDLFNKYDF